MRLYLFENIPDTFCITLGHKSL